MRPVLLLLAVAVVGCEASGPETAPGPEAVADLESSPACSPSDYQDWLQWAPDDDGDPRPALTMQCLPRELDRDADGLVNCVVIEVREGGDPACGDPGRRPVASEHADLLDVVASSPWVDPAWTTLCEIEQLSGDARARCEQDWPSPAVPGYCYLSNDLAHVGNAELVEGCGWQPPHALRFTGDTVAPNGRTFIACDEHAAECD